MFKTYIQEINNIKDLETVINYYHPNKLNKNKMSCPFHSDKTPSLSIVKYTLCKGQFKKRI